LLDTSFGNLLVEEEQDLEDAQTNSLDSEKTSNFETRNLQQSAPLPTTITTVIERSTQARAQRRQRSADTRETVLSSSYQVGDLRPYRKGIVVSEARPERVKLKTTRR
jgi:predicted GNAT superfamily acetyltransferase